MTIKDPTQWKGFSGQIRVEKHDQLRKLLTRLNVSSPAKLMEALAEDIQASAAALAPIVAIWQSAQAAQESQKSRQKLLASRLAELPSEEVERLLSMAAAAPAPGTAAAA